MSTLKSRLMHLSWANAKGTALVSAGVSVWSLTMLVGMGFQPGWANGWPMGISKHVVFTSFVASIFVVASLSAATAILIVFCYLAERVLKKPYTGWISFMVAMTLACVVVFATSLHVYAIVYADILREWP